MFVLLQVWRHFLLAAFLLLQIRRRFLSGRWLRSMQDSLIFRLRLRVNCLSLSLSHNNLVLAENGLLPSSGAKVGRTVGSGTVAGAGTGGAGIGANVGADFGATVGEVVGDDVGEDIGEVVTSSLTSVGADVGEVVGTFVGEAEGASVAGSGASVGEVVGDFVDGPDEGMPLGASLGWLDGSGGGPQNDGSRKPPVQTTDLIHSNWLPTVV